VARRVVSLLGILVLLALAATLLWQVYLHHREADPDEREESSTVRLEGLVADDRKTCAGFGLNSFRIESRKCGTLGAISGVRRKQIT
jgi:hypothetical protein